MTPKQRIYLLGTITLLLFPLPALLALYYIDGIPVLQTLDFGNFFSLYSLAGLGWGVLFALIAIYCFQLKLFENELKKQEQIILSLKLNLFDKIFLSFCAGFGEEVLFRAGVQHWLGIVITSLLFIAVHGYFNPKNWKLSLYGLLLSPFIISLGYAYEHLGLWFCIAAHFAYDFVLFLEIKEDHSDTIKQLSYEESTDSG